MKSRRNPISKYTKVRVGITIGDPAGIGPIVTKKAVNRLRGLADFVVIGDSSLFEGMKGCQAVNAGKIKTGKINRGIVRAEYGRASLAYLDRAIELLKNNEIDCLVTCPVSKEAVNKAGFEFLGHTEYLADKFRSKYYVMLLLNRYLKFSLATRHTPLKDVAAGLNKENLKRNILLTYNALKELFLIREPRIAVCGLNPHASDNGIIGDEENKIIKPLIARLRAGAILHLEGPFSADAAIARALRGCYDCLIAMYHDQALIPLKLTQRFAGANMTLGLPFIRTSPLHGTAFDIASQPLQANPASLIEAIRLAVRCTLNLKRD